MIRNRGRFGISRSVLPLILLATMHAASASAQSADDILHYQGPDREQKLIEGAKKEAQVVLYSALIVNQATRPIVEKFGKKYPFVKASYWRADSEDIAQKLSAEVRANNVVADVFEGTGVGELAVGANLAQPYYTPAIEVYPSQSRWHVDAHAAELLQHRLQHPPGAAQQGAEELRRSARPAMERQNGLAHRQRQRHAVVHHQSAARLGRGEGKILFR
jgi:hypothetical protein